MKSKKYIRGGLIAFFAMCLIIISCEDDERVKLAPRIETWSPINVDSVSATLRGFWVSGDYTEFGVAYSSTNQNPDLDDSKASSTETDMATYEINVTGLEYLTTYYAKAYAIQKDQTVVWGDSVISFTTTASLAYVHLDGISNITDDSATVSYGISHDGKSEITARGVCWSRDTVPVLGDDGTSSTEDGDGIGTYTSVMTGLRAATKYYVRAYATNEIGDSYSELDSITTENGVATVVTISSSTQTETAQVTGTVTYNGGASITERGIVWGTSENPTLSDNKVVSTATDTFEVTIEGLTPGTEYYARAYATNSVGTAYGNNISFTPGAMFMIGDGVGNWSWDETDLPMVPVNGHPYIYWKIVWMNATGGFKIAPERAWGNDMGKTGDATSGVYTIGSDNVPVPGTEGYYMVVIDVENNTIEVTEPQVYGIGDVFGSWDHTNPPYQFTVDNANEVIKFNDVANDGELRMHVAASTLDIGDDWWRAEFIIIDGNIEYRGRGGDQTRVSVTAGQDISLNFKAGTGSITD